MTEEEKRIRERIIRRKRLRQRQLLIRIAIGSLVLLVVLLGLIMVLKNRKTKSANSGNVHHKNWETTVEQPQIQPDYLPVNPYSRPGDSLEEVNGIVVHYTGNPMASAKQNRDYFAGLAISHKTSASSHFVVGLEGEIIQCIPTKEIAYASNNRNTDTLSIECCHPDETGEFTEDTYDSLVQLTAWLCKRFSLEKDDVIRHYDVTGKDCPRYFVQNEDAWEQFKEDVQTRKNEIISEEQQEKK